MVSMREKPSVPQLSLVRFALTQSEKHLFILRAKAKPYARNEYKQIYI